MEHLSRKTPHESDFEQDKTLQDNTNETINVSESTPMIFAETQAMLDAADFLKAEANPVARRADKRGLAYTLGQYSFLPLHIIDMLKLAKRTAERADWKTVAAELKRNIGQERGSDSEGISHYTILSRAMRSEFDLDTNQITIKPATDEFIRATKESLRHPDPHYVEGVAYALESSAVPELVVVLSFIKKLAGNRPLHPLTTSFFDKHLNTWEPSHENNLRQAIAPLIADERDAHSFREGFARTIDNMRIWWDKLAEEAQSDDN